MDSWSFPLGTFVPEDMPSPERREQWINDIADIPRTLQRIVQPLTIEQLLTPYRPGGWNVRQVVHHLADNDMNAYIRFKRALTEEAPVAGSYREDLWAELADYQDAPIELSLALLDALHRRFVILLRSLPPAAYERTFTSPTHGQMSLDHATQRFAWHGRHHIAQIRSLLERMGWVNGVSEIIPT